MITNKPDLIAENTEDRVLGWAEIISVAYCLLVSFHLWN